MSKVRVRFAPSPTGFAHIGNIRTAVFDWLLSRHHSGEFILRIEDTDRARIVPGSLEEIYESLKWLGIPWDEGPEVGGSYGPYFQSERLDIYREYAERLLQTDDAYYCFCASERLAEIRKEQEAKKLPTGYDRLCLDLTPEEIRNKRDEGLCGVVRFKVPSEGVTTFHDEIRGDISFENRLLDDFVILKSDSYPTYHFASVVDDHLMKITHVIRGEEWISSAPKHVLLYQALGWEPPKFVHPTLILGPDRSKLSKRHGAVRFLEYKEKGFLPEAMMNFITLLGWSPGEDRELFTVEELVQRFSIEGLVKNPVVFDIDRLMWMNGVYIRNCDLDRLTEFCLPYLREAGYIFENPSAEEMRYIRKIIELCQERMKTLSDIVGLTISFFKEELEYDEKGLKKWLHNEYVPELLGKLADALDELTDFSVERVEETVRQVGESMDVTGGKIIHPVRMAVTGVTAGPGLFETMSVLGKERVISRLRKTQRMLN